MVAHFVPAADEVGRLQRESNSGDPECHLFQGFCEQGHYGGRIEPSNTRQGIYAIAPSGHFLASVNTRRADRVARMLEQALATWRDLPDTDRHLSEEQRGALAKPTRWSDLYPEDGLVLRVTTRDLEREQPADGWHAHAWNRDYAWFTADEARQLLPDDDAVGTTYPLPDALARRLARFHLVDNVRGQTSSFPIDATEVELEGEVLAASERTLEVRITGNSDSERTGVWAVRGFEDRGNPGEQSNGFRVELSGVATYDREADRFTRFELVGLGERWGGTTFNARGNDLDRTPVGVVFEIADDVPAERVAPAHIWQYGWRRPR